MELSIFLAKVLGLYFLIVGIGILLNGQRIKGIITEIDSNPALLLFSGIVPLIVGTLVVVSHTVWEADWRVIVTLIGWLAFIKGIVRVVFPKLAMRFDGKIAKKPFLLKIFAIIILLLAAFLCFAGYMS
jgi:hypothetical protein